MEPQVDQLHPSILKGKLQYPLIDGVLQKTAFSDYSACHEINALLLENCVSKMVLTFVS